MGEVRYQVSVSVAGNRSVAIESDDPTIAQEAISWLRQRFGAAVRLSAPAVPTPVQRIQAAFAPSGATNQQSPICGVHGTAMDWVNRNGGFWSCHKKTNGVWCNYKPTQA
jgi:hypothetical protein